VILYHVQLIVDLPQADDLVLQLVQLGRLALGADQAEARVAAGEVAKLLVIGLQTPKAYRAHGPSFFFDAAGAFNGGGASFNNVSKIIAKLIPSLARCLPSLPVALL